MTNEEKLKRLTALLLNKEDIITDLRIENTKLKEQIEKMKRCVNCKHSLTMSDTKSPCNYCDTKFNKWELKEK